jgi:hypothetical protein
MYKPIHKTIKSIHGIQGGEHGRLKKPSNFPCLQESEKITCAWLQGMVGGVGRQGKAIVNSRMSSCEFRNTELYIYNRP